MKRTTGRSLGWLLIVAVVFLSLIPVPPATEVAPSDKLSHLLVYGVLAVWWLIAARASLVITSISLLALGAGLECLQALLPWRSFEWWDMVANALGVALGVLVAVLAMRVDRSA